MNLAIYRNLRLKNTLLGLTVGLLAYQIGKSVLALNTFSLSAWMIAFIKLGVFLVPVYIIAQMESITQKKISIGSILNFIRFKKPSLVLIMVLIICAIISGLVTSVLLSKFGMSTIVGQAILFGSIFGLFFLGIVKPELGSVTYLILHPFLMFTAGRLSAEWQWGNLVQESHRSGLYDVIFSLSYSDIPILFFSIGFVLSLFVTRGKGYIKTKIDIPIVLLLVWTLISVISARDPIQGITFYLMRWVIPVVFFYATLIAVKRNQGIKEIAIGIIFLLFMVSFFSIQSAIHTGAPASVIGTGERAKIWTVIGGQVGPWVALLLPIVISVLITRKESIVVRLLAGGAIFLSLIMIIWEMQRGVFFCFGVMFVLYALLYGKRWKFYLLFAFILGYMAFLFADKILNLIYLLRPVLLEQNIISVYANLDRWYLLKSAIELIRNNPLFGIGPGGFELLGIGYLYPETSSHNIILEIALESGIIAGILFLLIYFYPIVKSVGVIWKYRISNAYRYDLRPWTISLSSYFVFLMFSTCWQWGYGVAVMIILAVIVSGISTTKSQASIIIVGEDH